MILKSFHTTIGRDTYAVHDPASYSSANWIYFMPRSILIADNIRFITTIQPTRVDQAFDGFTYIHTADPI